jgi:hypothetical protein
MIMNWKGFRRKSLWFNQHRVPAFAWKNSEILRKFSLRMTDVTAKIRNKNFQNMSVVLLLGQSARYSGVI